MAPDSMKLGWDMDRLIMLRRVLINRGADECGVYLGQHHVLRYIEAHPGCSQKEVADALSQSAAAIALSTKRLQETGLITKQTDTENLRVNRLTITKKGEQNGRAFVKVIERCNNEMFRGFSGEELVQLAGFVERLRTNLDSSRGTGISPKDFLMEAKKINECIGKAKK